MKKNYNTVSVTVIALAEDAIRTSVGADNFISDWNVFQINA